MPDPSDQHIRSAKRRRIGRVHCSTDVHDSSLASVLDDCRVPLHDQANKDCTKSAEVLQKTENLGEILSGKYQHENVHVKHCSLKECMDSIMAELKEARENLLEWMRREIEAISTTTEANNGRQARAKGVGNKANDESSSQSQSLAGCKVDATAQHLPDSAGSKFDATAQHLHDSAGGTFNGLNIGNLPQHSELQKETTAEVGYVPKGSGTSSPTRGIKNCLLEIKNRTSGVMAADASNEKVEDDSNDVNQGGIQETRKENISDYPMLVENRENDFSSDKVVAQSIAFQNNESSREKLAENKDANAIYGPTEGFTFKINHDIEKKLDEVPERMNSVIRSQGRKSNSDTVGGLACSLSSSSHGKGNLGPNKVYNVGSYGSFTSDYATVYEEQIIKAEPGLGTRFITTDADGFHNRTNNEFPNVLNFVSTREAKYSESDNLKGMKLDAERKIRNDLIDTSDVPCRPNTLQGNKSRVGGRFAVQIEGVEHHLGTDSVFGCGIKRNHETAMSFNGFALEKVDDVMKGNEKLFLSDSFAPKSNSTAAKLIENIGPHPCSDKVKFRFWNENNVTAPASLSSIPLSRNAVNPILHGTHMNQTYHNKIGDIASTGRTGNFTGFDSHFSYPSQVQTVNGMLDVYQSRPSSLSVYFPNSEFLPMNGPSQFPPVSIHNPPSSSSSMLVGLTGIATVNQDPSNTHTFLGLGVNAQPTTMNQVQEFSGLYTRGSLYHNEAFKQASLASPFTVSNQKDSDQVRSSLELKF